MTENTSKSIYEQKNVVREDDLLSCLKYGLKVKYQSFNQEKTASGMRTTFTLQGDFDHCDIAMNGTDGVDPIFRINHTHDVYGNLESMRMSQDAGPIWNIDFVFTTEINWLGISTAKGSTYGKTSSELQARVMSMALEEHPFYQKCWNCAVWSNNPDVLFIMTESQLKTFYTYWIRSDAKQDYVTTFYGMTGDSTTDKNREDDFGGLIEFGSSGDRPPTTLLPKKAGKTQNWYKVLECTKPGVEYYEAPTYELTETSKASSKNKAAWAVSQKLGKISEPQEGDFGIKKLLKGNWLCEGASTRFDGKYWLTTMTFLHSPEESGWDTDLYDYEKGYTRKSWEEKDDLDPTKPPFPDGFTAPKGYRIRKVRPKKATEPGKGETDL